MKKRTFKIMTLALLIVVCLCAATMLSACHKEDTYYLSAKSSDWATYSKVDEIPDDALFTKDEDGYYILTVELDAYDSFAIYKVGSDESAIQSIFSTADKLSLGSDGKVAVVESGTFALVFDVASGELTYLFTPASTPAPGHECKDICPECGKCLSDCQEVECSDKCQGHLSTPDHVCQHQCEICGKCTSDCDDIACTEKCLGHDQPDPDVKVTNISISRSALSLLVDSQTTLTVAIAPSNAANKDFSWEIQGEQDVVAITADGLKLTVKGLKIGTAKLIVRSDDNPAITAECQITVTNEEVAVEEIYFDETELELTVGDNEIVDVMVYPVTATNQAFSWEIGGDQGAIKVELYRDNAIKITALKAGVATVTLVSEADPTIKSDALTVTVNQAVLTQIKIDSTHQFDNIGDTYKLVATLVPAGATATLTWATSNDSVATVNQDGLVTAVASGTAIITVTDLTGITAQCTVTVRQGVTSLTLSTTSLIVYTGNGASSREINVTINPSDATNTQFKVAVEQSGNYISYAVNGSTITITGLAVGSATITVTSEDNSNAKATCAIEVKDISDAVPYITAQSLTLVIGDTSDTIEVKHDMGEITSFTITSVGSSIAVASKVSDGDSGVFSFNVSALSFGYMTVKVVVTAGGVQTTIELPVIVTASYFYITGSISGVSGSWDMVDSESVARSENRLLENNGDGTYTLTREFKVGNSIQIIFPEMDSEWSNALTPNNLYKEDSSAAGLLSTTGDGKNIVFESAGTYTIKINMKTSNGSSDNAQWTVIVGSINITSASITSDQSALQVGKTTSANLTLTINPSSATYDPDDIMWSVDSSYSNWLTLTPSGDALTCRVALTDQFDSTVNVNAIITATITVNGVVTTATYSLALMPENGAENPVTSITFDNSSYNIDITQDGWVVTISAHVNSDATVQGVTFSLVDESGNPLGAVLVNNDANTTAFAITSSGVLTAKMFGTVIVRATSNGNGDGGSPVTNDQAVLFYANTFQLDIGWADDFGASNPSTSDGPNVYKWNEVELIANAELVVTYADMGDDWSYVIRSSGYLDSTSNNATGVTGGSKGYFTVTKTGVYNITLDLRGVKPSVKLEWVKDMELPDSLEVTVNIHDSFSYATPVATGKATITSASDSRTLTLTLDCSALSMTSWPNIEFTTEINNVKTYYNGSFTGVVFSGSKYSSSSSTSTWTNGGSGCKLWIASVTSTTTYTFVFTFDATGAITAIAIS